MRQLEEKIDVLNNAPNFFKSFCLFEKSLGYSKKQPDGLNSLTMDY